MDKWERLKIWLSDQPLWADTTAYEILERMREIEETDEIR